MCSYNRAGICLLQTFIPGKGETVSKDGNYKLTMKGVLLEREEPTIPVAKAIGGSELRREID